MGCWGKSHGQRDGKALLWTGAAIQSSPNKITKISQPVQHLLNVERSVTINASLLLPSELTAAEL